MSAAEAIQSKLVPGKLFINGKPEDAASGKTIGVINPATGGLLTSVPDGDAADIDHAVAARASFEKKTWRGMDPSKFDTGSPFGGYKQSGFGRDLERTRSSSTRT
jgi:acyl-CoA reductase-like NAD-dependent aldehyde dehydrogenase